MEISAGEFKTHCLKLMDLAQHKHLSIVITKRGKPVAKLVPLDTENPPRLFGCLKGSAEIVGDIMAPIEDTWHANS